MDYNSAYTGPQIDKAVGLALDKVPWQTNPNILINWDFTNPVDRNQGWVVPPGVQAYLNTNLTTAGNLTGSYCKVVLITDTYALFVTKDGNHYYCEPDKAVRGYVGDAWPIGLWHQGANIVSLIEDDGITLINVSNQTTSNIYFAEKVPFDVYKGEVVTASVLESDGTLTTGTVTLPEEQPTANTRYLNVTMENGIGYLQVSVNTDGYIHFVISTSKINSPQKLSFAKLELGTEQTLAHQDEDGNWVLNAHADYDEEYVKCLMYDRNSGVKFDSPFFVQQGQIQTNTNVNSVIKSGEYYCNSTVAPTIINAPFSTAFNLVVFAFNEGVNGKLLQIAFPGGISNNMKYRSGNSINGTWSFSQWYDFLTSAGGTVNGALTVDNTFTVGGGTDKRFMRVRRIVNDVDYILEARIEDDGDGFFQIWDATNSKSLVSFRLGSDGNFVFNSPTGSVTLTVDELAKLKELANA